MKKIEIMKREEYVEIETARMLEKAGFPVHLFQAPTNEFAPFITHAQAMRWLREEKKLSIRVNYSRAHKEWFFDMLRLDTGEYWDSTEYWSLHEAAAEAGIEAACRYLIKKGGEG